MPGEDDQPWTTARCNRLLRPISSRLTQLHKVVTRRRSIVGDGRADPTTRDSPHRAKGTQAKGTRARVFEKSGDPDWLPGAKPGVGKRTYGGRIAKKAAAPQPDPRGQTRGRPGEVAVPTPFISRTIGRIQDSPQVPASPLQQASRKRKALQRPFELQTLTKDMTIDMAKQVAGLLEAYGNLLQATKVGETRSSVGARSLVSMCLRQMPARVALEEYFEDLDKADADDKQDVSTELYTYLEEEYIGVARNGLRQVVRAHGTSLLCDAIENRTLGLETLAGFYAQCMDAKAWNEAEKFLWSFVVLVKPFPAPSHIEADLFGLDVSLYLHLVKNFVDITHRHQFLYNLLEFVISQDLLPLEWLATQSMHPTWSRIVRVLSDGKHRDYADAFRFLETALCAASGLPDESVLEDREVRVIIRHIVPSTKSQLREALNTTFSSLLTLLTSIALVSQTRAEDDDKPTVQAVTWVLDSLAVGLLRREDVRSDLELLAPAEEIVKLFAQRALWTAAAPLLVHLGGCELRSEMVSIPAPTLLSAISWVISQYLYRPSPSIVSSILETLPTFISSTARCSGKAWKDDGFDQLQRLIDALLSTSGFRLSHESWTLKRLALEACQGFAESTNDAQHFAYVRQIEKILSKEGRIVLNKSPSKVDESPATRSGFRWEEGIGEWVSCTPFARQDVKRLPRKPMRALELLPTPVQSDHEDNTTAAKIKTVADYESVREPEQHCIAFDDMPSPRSSPVKPYRSSRRTVSLDQSPRKRRRLLAVVIPSKRVRLTPNGSITSSVSTAFSASSQDTDVHTDVTSITSPPADSQPKSGRNRRSLRQTGTVSDVQPNERRSTLRNQRLDSGRSERRASLRSAQDTIEDSDELSFGSSQSDSSVKNPKAKKSKQEKRARGRARTVVHVSVGSFADDESSADELSFG